MKDGDIRKGSLDSLREMRGRGELHHDADAPEGPELSAEFWQKAVLKEPESKKPISLRVDRDVLDWFKSQGEGYQTRMNAVLRAYMESFAQRDR